MPAQFDPFKQKLPALNPVERRFPDDIASRKVGADAEDTAIEGYQVLDRANPRNPYDRNRPGLSGPVYDYDPYPDGY